MANEKELNPSPKFPTGVKPELSPNPDLHEGYIDKTDEKPNTQVSPTLNPEDKPYIFDRVANFLKSLQIKGQPLDQYLNDYINQGAITKIEVTNIKQLTDEEIDKLECGDVVVKKTGSQKHNYIVTYKENGVGICLSYFDASTIETVSYDYTDGHWVYNSTDKLEDVIDNTIEQSLLSGDLKTAFQAKTFGVSDYPLTSDIDSQHSTVNAGLLPNGDLSDLSESDIGKLTLTLNRIINKGWLKVGTIRALKLTSVMHDTTVISIVAGSTVYNASGILSAVSYLITLDIANSSYSYANATYTAPTE